MPCVITGSLAVDNRVAIDWGWQGFVAYGCQSFVVVWHPVSMERVHTLDGHKHNVVKVRWARENYPHVDSAAHGGGARGSHILRLASADMGGQIIVWDVLKGRSLCQFSDGVQKPILEMQWLSWQDLSVDLLIALHAPYNVILWNAQEGTRIWKKGYTESLVGFTLDPFQSSNVAFLTHNGNVMLIDDFSTNKTPSSNGQQFRVAAVSTQQQQTPSGASPAAEEPESSKGKQAAAALANLLVKKPFVKVLTSVAVSVDHFNDQISGQATSPYQIGSAGMGVGGLQSSPSLTFTSATQTDESTCLHLTYHRAVRNRLMLLYARELVVLDVVTMQSVAQVMLDRSASPFVHVYACAQRDALYFFQENGCVTLRLQKYRNSGSSNTSSSDAKDQRSFEQTFDVYEPLEIFYESACASESLRVTKTNRILTGAVCPVTERRACQIMSYGRLLSYELASGANFLFPAFQCLADDVILDEQSLNQEIPVKLRFLLCGVGQSLASAPTVVRACPKPSGPGRQLAAVGFGDGGVQLVDLHSGDVERDFGLHSCPIKCLEWSGADHLVSSGYCQTLSTSSVVRNEILLTDIRTGYSRRLRGECDESPVEMLRVSFFSCFLAIAFRDQPMEIWDLKQFRLLRRMSKNCPTIVDMAWSTKHHQSRVVSADAPVNGEQAQSPAGAVASPTQDDPPQTIYRENLVVLDNENHLYHVVVKGIHVRDGKEVNTQWATNSMVTCMVWKADILAFGDTDGRLSVWNLEAKTSKATGQQRGAIRRLQMSRSPSDFTLIALHADGVAVWNALRFECLQQLMTGPAFPWRIMDADLAGDENWPLLISSDGALRVYDRFISGSTSNRSVEALLSQKLFTGRYQASAKTAAFLKILLLDSHNLRRCYSNTTTGIDLLLVPELTADESNLIDLIKRLDCDEQDKWTVIRQLALVDETTMAAFNEFFKTDDNGKRSADRCLSAARLLGDEWECNFWTVAKYYLITETDKFASVQLLPTSFESYWRAADFKRLQIKQCAIFDYRRATNEQRQRFIDVFIQLGLFSQASQLLLDTEDSQRADYYADCLKACLLSALTTKDAEAETSGAGTTIKSVATSLIANGRLDEGVQLLTMIGKALDACRYLQSFGHWERSSWLARVSLPTPACREVLGKWIDALQSPQTAKKTMAVLLLISCGQWEKVIDSLIGSRQVATAVQLLSNSFVSYNVSDLFKEKVHSEYARQLADLGLMKAARFYAEKAGGERGACVLKEINILTEQ